MRTCRFVMLASLLAGCSSGTPQSQPALNATASGRDNSFSVEDRRLLAAATIALPPPGLSAESLPEPASRGAQVMGAFCVQCHALPSPAMHAAQDWPSVARRMWVRIDRMHGELGVLAPSSADRVQLLDYLLGHSLRVADSLPPGRGRVVFEAICSQCHLLPDPRTHSAADWQAVVMRMERNMERMKIGGVTADQAQSIIRYLASASELSSAGPPAR